MHPGESCHQRQNLWMKVPYVCILIGCSWRLARNSEKVLHPIRMKVPVKFIGLDHFFADIAALSGVFWLRVLSG